MDFLSCKNEIIEEKSRHDRQSWQVPRKLLPIHVPTTLSFYVLRVRYEKKMFASQVYLGNRRAIEMCAWSKVETGKGKAKGSHDAVVNPGRHKTSTPEAVPDRIIPKLTPTRKSGPKSS